MANIKKNKWKDPEFKKMMIEAKHKNLGTTICKVCNKEFRKNIYNQTMCSKECKQKHRNKQAKERRDKKK
jgi:hypothetical protein